MRQRYSGMLTLVGMIVSREALRSIIFVARKTNTVHQEDNASRTARMRFDSAPEWIGQVLFIGLLWTTASDFPVVGDLVAADLEIVPFKSEWKVLNPLGALDDPDAVDVFFDTTWFLSEFDDGQWETRTAPFVYGGVNAIDRQDPFPLLDPGDGDRFSAYFRLPFEVEEEVANLALDFVADDGAVFYLDGEEVLRHNCCSDQFGRRAPDDYLSFATQRGNEDSFTQRSILAGQTLPPGQHFLAVSVHQGATISDDLGFEARLLSIESAGISLFDGIDTTISQFGLSGPDRPHGGAGENPDGVERWEWDQFDAGGENQGLLWFELPEALLRHFNNGRATLRLHVDNAGDAAALHRMTVDWLSGARGGDDVTWNSIPGGPGVVVGRNAEVMSNSTTGDLIDALDEVIEIDVSLDVTAWARGQPNYGWGFVPAGGDGTGITSFESLTNPIPELVLFPGDGLPDLEAGDADEDLDFDQLDLVKVLAAGKYRTGDPATWGEGDWNGAPGGGPGSPPVGDGIFDQLDIIVALGRGLYLSGRYAVKSDRLKGQSIDSLNSLDYDPGDVALNSVPEPCTLGLGVAAMGLLALGIYRPRDRLCPPSEMNGAHHGIVSNRSLPG